MICMTKYVNPRNPLDNVHIKNISIPNTLVIPIYAINLVTKKTNENFQSSNLHQTPTVLHLDYSSTSNSKVVLEYIVIYVDF